MQKDGAVMVVNIVHPSNAETEMAVRFVGKCTDIREEQFLKIPAAMVVIQYGSVTTLKELHS